MAQIQVEMMSSTLRKERPPVGVQQQQQVSATGAHAQLGSEGSSRESEASSVDTGTHPDTVDVTVVLPDRTSKTVTVDYG